MKQSEINSMNMSDTVIAGLNAEKAKWETKKPIVTAVNNVKGFRAELTGLSSNQASLITQSATETIKAFFTDMVELSLEVIQRLRPFALANNDKALLAKIDYTKTDLTHTKQIDTINMCKIALEQGKEKLDLLVDYELTADMLDALESAINGVAMLSGNRDSIIGTRKTATEGIPVLLKKISLQLEILDDLVPVLIDDANFVQTYKNNRRIIDR